MRVWTLGGVVARGMLRSQYMKSGRVVGCFGVHVLALHFTLKHLVRLEPEVLLYSYHDVCFCSNIKKRYSGSRHGRFFQSSDNSSAGVLHTGLLLGRPFPEGRAAAADAPVPSRLSIQMLQQTQQKLEPITIMEMEAMEEADHQQHTASAASGDSQPTPLLVLTSPEPLPPD